MAARIFVIAVIAFISFSERAFAWAYQGHEVTGAIADQLLGPNARQQVANILGFELRVAAPWADCVRSVARLPDGTFRYAPTKPEYRIPCTTFETPAETARMEDYVSRNWLDCEAAKGHGCGEAYHFADVAIQHDDYKRGYVGTSDHDIVGAINAAISVLRGQPAPLPFSIRDKKEALLLLAHFVGDLHQPLHVGAVYLDQSGQLVNPDQGGLNPATETRGGNLLGPAENNLHSQWDAIAEDLGENASPDLIKKAKAVGKTPGPVDALAATWASETVMVSHAAFAGLSFAAADHGRWQVRVDDEAAYATKQAELKHDQLAKGGARLAQILNSIWPTPVEKTTACTLTGVCYCVTAANRDAITANVARVRQLLADQRAAGRMTGYLSIPLSTLGGGYFGVNRDVAQRTKERIEQRFGSSATWVLNPGAEGNLPETATGADYMYMWTQILEGRGGYGEDIDFFYFAGPTDFAQFFGLTGAGDADRIEAYFDQRLGSDPDLMKTVNAGRLSKRGFRNYYALRAAVTFSAGSHDEWNIVQLLNQRRRGSEQFGIGNQIGVLFDGHAIAPGDFEAGAASGTVGRCN
ncbi:S1/P1 nuclease [Bradyrhizobium nitroreducens]|uniref:S1/P1 nuclease n=1 Tax=Bradyrhizobium nitroreducens TaxID=709803 RepID=UPI0013749F72|nr:S1/P1 nuclease [Bradyrhizobium nitroreducens]